MNCSISSLFPRSVPELSLMFPYKIVENRGGTSEKRGEKVRESASEIRK